MQRKSALDTLTRRERETVDLLRQGQGPEEIASRLGILPHSAENHIHEVYSKLGIQKSNRMAKLMLKYGLTEVNLPLRGSPRSITIDSAAHLSSNLWEKLMYKIGDVVRYSGRNYEIFEVGTDSDGYIVFTLIEAGFHGDIDAGEKSAMILVRDLSGLQAVA